MWEIFWSIKFDHFKAPLDLKMNRHFYLALGFYARVYGKLNVNLHLTSELERYVDDIICYVICKHGPNLPDKVVDGLVKLCVENKMRISIKKMQNSCF